MQTVANFQVQVKFLKICTDIILSAYVILTEDKLNNN